MTRERDALAQAMLLLDAFIAEQHAAAIPAMIGSCVGWAVEHGAGDQMRSTLRNALVMTDNAERAWKEKLS